jgi:lipopolysaccharide biosynthesis glycosyltransferase
MHIVFCADYGALPGLHVAAYSLLARMGTGGDKPSFHVLSEQLGDGDLALLHETLSSLNRPYDLEIRRIDAAAFAGCRDMHGNRATYHRLLAANVVDVDRFLYVDADMLCDLDVGELAELDLAGRAVGMVPEGELTRCADEELMDLLGPAASGLYFNAGAMLVDVQVWRRNRITERCLDYLAQHQPRFWDQSALNYVLRGQAVALDAKFNFRTNARDNWPLLRQRWGTIGKLIHFLDYPKPWEWLGKWIHPQCRLWNEVSRHTAIGKWKPPAGLKKKQLRMFRKQLPLYKKTVKDRILFFGYSKGWFRRVKGVPSEGNGSKL